MAVPAKFTPVQGSPPPPAKSNAPIVPIIAVIVYVLYLGIFIVGPKFVSTMAEEFDPMFPPLWRLVGAGLLFVILAIVIITNLLSKPASATPAPPKPLGTRVPPPSPPQATPPKFKPVVKEPEQRKPEVQVKKVEDEPIRSQVITYPLEVEGGIFGDTYIGLSPNKVIKIRSMVVEPEYLS